MRFFPYAASLRMGEVGYYSKNQAGLKIDYDPLSHYVDSLRMATGTPYEDYRLIGVKKVMSIYIKNWAKPICQTLDCGLPNKPYSMA